MVVLEISVRFLPPPYDPEIGNFYSCHPTLGWTGAPDFQGMIEGAGFQQEVKFNVSGMHDREHTLTKPPNTFRILMLGDSYVQAVQVSEAETAHQVLEDHLNEALPDDSLRYEVLSGGVINWGTNQQLIYYREQGRQFQPDLVLLMFFIGNDFLDNLPGNLMTISGFNCYAPYFALCDDHFEPESLTYAPGLSHLQHNCRSTRRVLINMAGWFYQHSRLYRQLEPLITLSHPRQQFGQAYPSPFSALYLPDNETELEQAWQITQATIAQLQQEVEADGGRFAVVLVSPGVVIRLLLLSPTEQAVFLRDNPDFAEVQAGRPNNRLAEFLDHQHIPFMDLTQPMRDHLAAHSTPLYLLGDGHWTVEGNRVVAEVLAQWLTESYLLPERAGGDE